MTRLDIRLLGEFAVVNGGTPLTSINSQRLQCLLAYLLLNRDAPVSRQRLAFLFWPDSTEAQARSNLRNLLHTLGQALPNNGEHFIDTDGQTVQWRAGTSYTLDVDTLLAALDQAQTAQDLQQALALYRGLLLPSCYDDWIVPERERLEQHVADVVQGFIDRCEQEGAYRDAITFAQQIVRRDPLREDLYRQIMRLHALSGNRAGIARTYKECRDVLKRELDVEPSRQTVAAYEKYKQLEVPGADPATPAPPPEPAPAASAPAASAAPATAQFAVTLAAPPATASLASPAPGYHSPDALVVASLPKGEAAAKQKTSREPVTDAVVRRAVLSDALQHPATEIPLALSATSGLFLLLYVPALTGLPGAAAAAAWALLVVSAIVGAGSFIWQYGVNGDKNREQKAHLLRAEQRGASQLDEQEELNRRRKALSSGFKEKGVAEGQSVLEDLDFVYVQLLGVIARHKETDSLALSYLPALVDETYRQGLSVLEDALDLALATSSQKNQRLDAEIKELEDKVGAAAGKPSEAARVYIWQESLTGLRHRQELISKESVRLDELLQHASRCETALNQTWVELAALKADDWTVSVNAVLETLQKTIDQAKAVQEEMRKLGY